MMVSLIAAVSDDNVIGKGGEIPWHLPADLKRFKALTIGKPIIMGRKTYESIGRPLPGRRNIVLTHDASRRFEGADVVTSFEEALKVAKQDGPDVFVIGGENIYALALPFADELYLTRVHTMVDGGDAFFPAFNESEWHLEKSERHEADSENPIAFTYLDYVRK